MLELLVLMGRAVTLARRGHQELVLENMALQQQLRALKRTTKRPHLRTGDRLILDRPGSSLAELAHGLGARSAGHRRAMASRLAPPSLDPTFKTAGWRSPNHR